MIKKIYTFGTSCTAGGGFEFESKYKHRGPSGGKLDITRGDYIKKLYSEIPYTQNNYSYPGQLQKLLNNTLYDIDVVNISKQGYGNERIYRKFHEVLNLDEFNKDESLFIFEFSDLCRLEFYYKPLDNHIVMNYKADDTDSKNMSIQKSYFYDNWNEIKLVNKNYELFREFKEHFVTVDNQLIEFTRKYIMFLDYLKYNKFKFLISGVPEIFHSNYQSYENSYDEYVIPFGFDDSKKYKTFNIFADNENLTIMDETSKGYCDLHPSLFANKIIAKMVYNEMIRNEYINGDIIKITDVVNFKENLKISLT